MRIVPAHLSALYKNKLCYLWVEDEDTRTYPEAVWADPEIGIFVAGGGENIGAVVHAARKDGLCHVFGYRDRDFGMSNRAGWNDPAVEVFVSDAHEVENLAPRRQGDGGLRAEHYHKEGRRSRTRDARHRWTARLVDELPARDREPARCGHGGVHYAPEPHGRAFP